MQVRIISFTDRGQQLAELLADRLCGTATRCGRDCSLSEWVRDAFDSADALIYVLRGRNRSSRQQQILPTLFQWMRGRGYRDVLWRTPDG